jgi:hypothetical protein
VVPDFIFNRRGPLHLMTWASLLVECTCVFLIWPTATRKLTLIAIVLLHVGIDFAMNMHCFEWLSMLGWLFFLIEPQQRTRDHAVVPTTAKSGTRYGRWCMNIFLLTIITIFFVDSVPLSDFSELIPYEDNVVKSTLLSLHEFRGSVLIPKFYEPYMAPLGIYQGVWNLFTGSNDQNFRYEVKIALRNGTEVSHISPDWGAMTWYEKKRWQRPMTFYENFEDGVCKDCYARYYASLYDSRPNYVASVSIISTCEYPPDSPPPDNIFDREWFFSPAKQPLIPREPQVLYTLNMCDDIDDRCEQWVEDGLCDSNDDRELFTMTMYCRWSCRMCHIDAETIQNGTRISLFFDNSEQYYDATVRDTEKLHFIQRYLLQYEGYEDAMEWTTAIALRRKGVIIYANASVDIDVPRGSDPLSESHAVQIEDKGKDPEQEDEEADSSSTTASKDDIGDEVDEDEVERAYTDEL